MVRLIKADNTKLFTAIVDSFFGFQQYFTHIERINEPELDQKLYGMWHSHQCCIYGFTNHEKTNVMISRSKDGEVVASAIQHQFGFKVVRGSTARSGAVEATKQLIELLKNGESGAIMVDGPRGPVKKVKNGIVKIARITGVPIVPVVWYSPNFNLFKLPSWDGLQMPVLDVRLINLYGEPIYVPSDLPDDKIEDYRVKLQMSLEDLEARAPEEYNKVYWHGLWKRKIKK